MDKKVSSLEERLEPRKRPKGKTKGSSSRRDKQDLIDIDPKGAYNTYNLTSPSEKGLDSSSESSSESDSEEEAEVATIAIDEIAILAKH